MKRLVNGFAAALQFLTIAPPLQRRTFTAAETGSAVAWFPLVGLLIGLLLFGLHRLLQAAFPPALQGALLLAIWIGSSGALHFDGFLDAVDGLLGGNTVEDRLRILRDVHVGAFAVAAGIALLLLKYAALTGISAAPAALIAAPLLGRWAMSAAVTIFPYARETGLGRAMKDNAGWPQAVVASAISLAALGILAPTVGIVPTVAAVAVVGVSAWLLIRFTLARIPGLTGDMYGAICEVGETLCLLTLAAKWSW